MYIFAEPVTEEQVAEVQNANQAKAEEFERNVLGRTSSQDNGPEWEDIVAQVEKAMDKDELASTETDEAHSGSENLDNLDVHDSSQLGIEASGADDPGRAMMEEEDVEENDDETNVDAQVVAELDEEEKEAAEEEANDESEALIEEEDGGVPEGGEAVEQEEAAMAEGPTLVDIEDGSKERLSEETLSLNTAENTEDISTSNEPEQAISTSTRLNGLTLTEALAPSQPSTDNDAQDAHNPETNNNNDADSGFVTEADTSFLDVLSSDASQTATAATATPADDILAMTLTLRNKVNGAYVLRPTDMTAKDKWEIEYSLVEVPLQTRARALYNACQVRRQKKLASDDVVTGADGTGAEAGAGAREEVISGYVRRLREMSAQGKIWRAERDKADKANGEPVKVLGKQHQQQSDGN